jgi:hypothetical protein
METYARETVTLLHYKVDHTGCSLFADMREVSPFSLAALCRVCIIVTSSVFTRFVEVGYTMHTTNIERYEGGTSMSDPKHPELNVDEEPRNDFMDTAIGFGVFFAFLLLMGIVATVITLLQGS